VKIKAWQRVQDMAEATPARRDRYIDFLRAASIAVVVLGHWLIAVIERREGQYSGINALDVVPGLWLATWILQVMPIFFFVGGFSNQVTIDSISSKGGSYAEFIRRRLQRLMRPTLVFLAVWIPLTIAIDLTTGVGDDTLDLATGLLTRPLWFIGIYLIMIAFAPPMLRLHRRWGRLIPGTLALAAALVDALAMALGLPVVGFLNFAFVWLFVHQLGFFYGERSLGERSRSYYIAMCLVGLAILAALTASGAYSPSMVGLRGERSNTNPPTMAIVALTVWQVGLIMLLRPALTRWLQRARVWAGVIFVNAQIMTMFLWHQTAMLLAAGILLPLGFPQPPAGSAAWWATRPLWVAALVVFLAALVIPLGGLERSPGRSERPPILPSPGSSLVAVVGAAYVLTAILGFAVTGFDSFAGATGERLVLVEVTPLLNTIHLIVGLWLLRLAARPATAVIPALALVALGLAGPLTGLDLSGVLGAGVEGAALHLLSALTLALAAVRAWSHLRGSPA
jgi:fucose 4-O-acetylase-like acetyltransferase